MEHKCYTIYMNLQVMSPAEIAEELGNRVQRERLRQNLTQQTLADRAGVSRVTVARFETTGTATLTNFLSILSALQRAGDLQHVLEPFTATTIEEFTRSPQVPRQRGRL